MGPTSTTSTLTIIPSLCSSSISLLLNMFLLFQDLFLALLLSLFLSLLFTTAKAVSKFDKNAQFDAQNYADDLFDEFSKTPACGDEEEEAGESVGCVEGKVFDECPVRLKGDDYEEVVKKSGVCEEGVFRVIELEEGFDESLERVVLGQIASKQDYVKAIVSPTKAMPIADYVKAIEDHRLSKEATFRVVELEQGFGESRERLKLEGNVERLEVEENVEEKNWKYVGESEKINDKLIEVKEVEIKSEIFGESISSDDESRKRDNNCELLKEWKKNKDNVSEVEDKDEEWLEDWEGIERTELEKEFGDAVVFVGSKKNVDCISNFDNEVKAKLYGLHKVVIEGACHAQQPMALKVSARAKWNAWHLLGDMSREVAMEQYIALLSKSLPEWKIRDCHVFADV